jgi:hypothetical protein
VVPTADLPIALTAQSRQTSAIYGNSIIARADAIEARDGTITRQIEWFDSKARWRKRS